MQLRKGAFTIKKRLVAMLLMTAFFLGSAYVASTYQRNIRATYGIGLTFGGTEKTLTDVNGKTVQPFVYEGTTDVPLRAVSENLGAGVSYDAAANKADIQDTATIYTTCVAGAAVSMDYMMVDALCMFDQFCDKTYNYNAADAKGMLDYARLMCEKLDSSFQRGSRYAQTAQTIRTQLQTMIVDYDSMVTCFEKKSADSETVQAFSDAYGDILQVHAALSKTLLLSGSF